MFPITLTFTIPDEAGLVKMQTMLAALTSAIATEAPAAKNSPSSRATPARTEPTASGAADGAQGKTGGASGQAADNAAAEPQASTAAIDFETLKKAFLALSNTPDGRTKCEAVLKPFGAAKLSALTPEQYGDAMAKITELGA